MLARLLPRLLGVVLLLGSLVLVAARLKPLEFDPWVLVTSLAPYALVGFVLAALFFLIGRSRLGVLLALVGVGVQAVWLAPLYVGAHPGGKPDLTVMSANLQFGEGDANQTVKLAAERRVDVVVLQEVSQLCLAKLREAGIEALLPNTYGIPSSGVSGTIVFSRYPITQGSRLKVQNGAYLMRIEAPKPFWLVSVHTGQPVSSVPIWQDDHSALYRALRELRGPRLAVGDFNATLDHSTLKRLLGTGLRDAAEDANSGWQPTWPTRDRKVAGISVPFPVFAIDHVLLSKEFGAISTDTFPIAQTDHRALVALLHRN